MHPNELLSQLVAYRTYSARVEHLERRESIEETINRNMNMHLDRFPKLSKDITKAYNKVHGLEVMPSMRSMQYAGSPVVKNNSRIYNCSAANIDDVRVFGEALYLLLAGVGFGYSVQKRHVNKLPKVRDPKKEGIFFVHDSIEGWAQALDALMDAYLLGRIRPIFNFSNISPKGTYLATAGARAPGADPLKKLLDSIERVLKSAVGRKLRSIEVHDIMCYAADGVVSGGIRRAALIALFDQDDEDMLHAKSGEWWVNNPQRARANNSAILIRNSTTKSQFDKVFSITQASGSGEPGFSWTDDPDMLFNPCHEVALESAQFCNLTTVSQTGIKNKKDFLNRIYAATLLGTLQASYTDFGYLRPEWKNTTENGSLIGVSFTGIADAAGLVTSDWLQEGASLVKEINAKYAAKIGINPAHRTTTIKPEGSASCVLGSSSGIHDRHSKHYLRRFRINKGETLDNYLRHVIPSLVEDDLFSATMSVVTIPQASPEGSITRHDTTALDLLERVYAYNTNWVHPGHREGANKNNVSATVSVREHEWEAVRESMWANRNKYSGISLLPFDGGTYAQAPFEDCDEATYNHYANLVQNIDLMQVKEPKEEHNVAETVACAGGVCEVTSL